MNKKIVIFTISLFVFLLSSSFATTPKLNEQQRAMFCDVFKHYLPYLAFLALAGPEVGNTPPEVLSSHADSLRVFFSGNKIILYRESFDSGRGHWLGCFRHLFFDNDQERSGKIIIEVNDSQDDHQKMIEVSSPKYRLIAKNVSNLKYEKTDDGLLSKYTQQEFSDLVRYCARRKVHKE